MLFSDVVAYVGAVELVALTVVVGALARARKPVAIGPFLERRRAEPAEVERQREVA
jgi:hypothetical protein